MIHSSQLSTRRRASSHCAVMLSIAIAPWIDGAIAMLSITAQWLLARRRVESWFLWILVDLIAVPLFASRGLYATSAVYVVLLGLSIDGLIQWRRAAATGRVAL